MILKTYSHQTYIVPVHQNRAIFRDTCFIKLPTKDQSSLINLNIMILVQFPTLVADMIQTTDSQG